MATTLQACLTVICVIGLFEGDELQLKAPDNWRGETISLPPSFAPNMKVKGTEVIRFAPGMFESQSDSFFSYVFVFELESKKELAKKTLHDEMLVYYRGLASSVLKNRNVEFDPKSFKLKLEESKTAAAAAQPKNAKVYVGELAWLEPFVTRKPQTLHLELHAWKSAQSGHTYLFVCASPKKTTTAIWKQMRGIRKSFFQAQE